MKLYSGFILFLVLSFSTYFTANGQSSQDFNGQWWGFININGKPGYKMHIDFSNPQKKNITGVLSIHKYDIAFKAESTLPVLEKTIVFDYDKQKRITYTNTSLPSGEKTECTGWLILKVNKENSDTLEVSFRTNKDCMISNISMYRPKVKPEEYLIGNWLGYITIDGKPAYKLQVLTDEKDDNTYTAGIYYSPFTKNGDAFRYDTVKLYMNDKDTSAQFDIAIPKKGGGDYCKGRVTVKRLNLSTLQISTAYKPYSTCGNVFVFLNEPQTMLADAVYANAPAATTETHTKDTVKVASNNTNQTANNELTIDPKDITHPSDKDFKWYDWDKAPKALIAGSRLVHTFKDKKTQKDNTLYEDISDFINNDKCKIRIAAVDLDDDGIWGLAFEASGLNCCGTMGCTFGLFDNGGLKIAALITDRGPVPDKNRVKGDDGNFYSLRTNTITVDVQKIETLFKYNHTATGQPPKTAAPVIPAGLTGGTTPDNLGRTMLKALQTNNKKLWASCIHPTYDFETDPDRRQRVINEFDKIRRDLEAEGISDWSKVQFSRTVSEYCDRCAAPGEKWLSELVVEFWYKGKEFIGKISFTPVMTYKGKYYVGRNYDHDMIRYNGKF